MIDGSTCPACSGDVSTTNGTEYECVDVADVDGAERVLPKRGRHAGRSRSTSARNSKWFFLPCGVDSNARRLSSDWESTRLKIELSPVQIREAASFLGVLPRDNPTEP